MNRLAPIVRGPATAFATALLVAHSLLPAQLPPCLPPTSLASNTPFQATHYQAAPGQNNTSVPPVAQNLPAVYHGFGTYVNLTANAPLSVSQIDYRLNDDGFLRYNWSVQPGTPGGPGMLGQTSQVSVYRRREPGRATGPARRRRSRCSPARARRGPWSASAR